MAEIHRPEDFSGEKTTTVVGEQPTELPKPSKEELWRRDVLLRAGYTELHAALLASARHVDLHIATDLVEHGCDPFVAFDILA